MHTQRPIDGPVSGPSIGQLGPSIGRHGPSIMLSERENAENNV